MYKKFGEILREKLNEQEPKKQPVAVQQPQVVIWTPYNSTCDPRVVKYED